MPLLPRSWRPDRERLNLLAHALLRRAAGAGGYDLVRADFNSPLVDTRRVRDSLWDRGAPTPGIELGLERQLELIENELAPFIDQLEIPLHPAREQSELHLDNPWYGPMDAHLLYALLRYRRPRRVLELGSGFSSLLIDLALRDNDGPSATARHEIVDPHPSELLAQLGSRASIRRQPAVDLEQEAFERLQAGDVLFVDTTHVVKPGGEVVRIVLEVLPTLAPGVIVHFHDIFIPFPYPRIFYERYNVHWQEQYLLQAFLAFNPGFEVLLSSHALWRLRTPRIRSRFRGLTDGMQPGAFWLVRTDVPLKL